MEPTPFERAARRSATAWVAVVALVAGAAGGFAGGRLSASNDDTAAGAKVAAVGGAPNEPTDVSRTDSASAPSVIIVQGGVAATGSSGSLSKPSGPIDYKPPTMTRLFKRTVAGVELRASRVDENMTNGCRGNGCPPPDCFPTSRVQVTTVDTWDVGGGGGSLWAKIDQPAVVTGMLYPNFRGTESKDAVTGYVVQTDASVAKVRWIASDGSLRDEMAPDHGVAVLAARLPFDMNIGPLANDGSSIVALDAAGKVLVRITMSVDERTNIGGPSQKCIDAMKGPNAGSGDGPTSPVVPSQPLPAKGEQPADVAAAEKAVRATFAAALGGGGALTVDSNIDDPDGLQELRDASAKQFPQYAGPGKVKFVLDELVFTSPTRASFRYRVLATDNDTLLASHVGTARVVNGKWLITRATVCELLPVHPNGNC